MLRRSTAVEHIHQQPLFHNSVQQSCSGPRSPLPWPSFNHVFNRRSDLIVLFLGPYVWHPFSSFSWLFSTCSAVTTCSASLLYVSTILGAPFCSHYSPAEFLSNVSPAVNQQPIKQSAEHRAVTFLWRLLPNWQLLTQSFYAWYPLSLPPWLFLHVRHQFGRFHLRRFRSFRCLARLSDASLVPTLTRATLHALGAGDSAASTISPQSYAVCATTTSRHHHKHHRIPPHPAAGRA